MDYLAYAKTISVFLIECDQKVRERIANLLNNEFDVNDLAVLKTMLGILI
jgi:hypothetical protein